MTNSQRLATVRAHLRDWLRLNTSADDGGSVADADQEIVSESILIFDGFYAGRTFFMPSHRADWFIESDELKIHGPGGEVLAVFSGEEIGRGQDPSERPASLPMIRPRRDDGPSQLPKAA